jgi:hypothetical protein
MNQIDNIMALAVNLQDEAWNDGKYSGGFDSSERTVAAFDALLTAIEQALTPGEPVAWMVEDADGRHFIFRLQRPAVSEGEKLTPLYTTPQPQPKQEPVKCKHGVDDGACKECYHDTAAHQPQPKREHDLKDVRCECCGYMTYHREHMGCIRAAIAQGEKK